MIDALLQQTNLWEARKKSLSTFSGGMKQRFGIAQALLANPRLIIVDEPTAGLDPAERNRFLNLLSSIGRDVTVILSTHIVDDVRELCPRMAIIATGELLLEGAPADTLAALNGKIWSKVVSSDDELRALESQMHRHLDPSGRAASTKFVSTPMRNPGDGFHAVDSELEDVYFLNLSRQAKKLRRVRDSHGNVLGVFLIRTQAPTQEYFDLHLLRLCGSVFAFLCVASREFRSSRPTANGKVLLNGPYANIGVRYRHLPVRHHHHRGHLRHVHPPRLPTRYLPDAVHQAHFEVCLSRRTLGGLVA